MSCGGWIPQSLEWGAQEATGCLPHLPILVTSLPQSPHPHWPCRPCRVMCPAAAGFLGIWRGGAQEATEHSSRPPPQILKQYRVLDIHDKYYNKWFMSKVSQKIFGKNSRYKLKVRMQEVSAVQEYRDIDLDDNTYKKEDISRLLTDDVMEDIVGKSKSV